MKLVVTGNRNQFLDYCRENKLNPHDPLEAVHIRNRIDMLGYRNVDIVFYGTYYETKEFPEIQDEAKRAGVNHEL